MSCDIDYRYRRALQPDGLTTFENALRALNEAVDDVRLAGRQAATCPAVLLLTRHLQRIADGRSRPSTWCNFGGGPGSSSGGLCGDV